MIVREKKMEYFRTEVLYGTVKEKPMILKLERHMYAPELNKIHLVDGSIINAPHVTTIKQAELFIKG